ncbi:MAG: sigma-54 dependent transcriptional regulator [Bryobacteraceae bacterium]
MIEAQPPKVLWVAAEDRWIKLAQAAATAGEFTLEQAPGLPEALEYVKRASLDAVVVCCPLPDWSAAAALEEIKCLDHRLPAILCDPETKFEEIVDLVKMGAFDLVPGDADISRIVDMVGNAIDFRRSQMEDSVNDDEPWRRTLVGSSQPFQNVVRMVRLVGARRCTVLVTGETGTGKEMVARAVHLAGPRSRLPMVSVCCSALPENLLEAELFGHVRGAFTGAINQRIGRFEQANGSTLFLDEIGDMPIELQAKLLRVLQEREFQRLGSSETIRVDVRVVAATNVDLAECVQQGRFREDLYYRLNVVPIRMPALRERRGDIVALARHFVRKICRAENIPEKEICRDGLDHLLGYDWPGNVRQLENAVEQAIILSGDRNMLFAGDFPLSGGSIRKIADRAHSLSIQLPDDGLDFERTVDRIARSMIEQALQKTNGNKKAAADMLRLKRTTLAAKMRSLESGEWEAQFSQPGLIA